MLVSFTFFAGMFSVAWKPENEYKAIGIGASLPTIVATLFQTAPKFGSQIVQQIKSRFSNTPLSHYPDLEPTGFWVKIIADV